MLHLNSDWMIGQRAKIHRNNCLWWILIFAKAGTGSSPHFFETLSEKPEDIRNSQRAMALHHRVRTAASCLVRALNKSLVNTNPSFPCKEVSGSSRALLKKRQSLVQNPEKKSLEPCILWYMKYKFFEKERNHKALNTRSGYFLYELTNTQFLPGTRLVPLSTEGEKVNKSWRHLSNSSTAAPPLMRTKHSIPKLDAEGHFTHPKVVFIWQFI